MKHLQAKEKERQKQLSSLSKPSGGQKSASRWNFLDQKFVFLEFGLSYDQPSSPAWWSEHQWPSTTHPSKIQRWSQFWATEVLATYYSHYTPLTSQVPQLTLRHSVRMSLGICPAEPRNWKWPNGVGKSEMSIFLCISITNNVKTCKKFNESTQTTNFIIFTRGHWWRSGALC